MPTVGYEPILKCPSCGEVLMKLEIHDKDGNLTFSGQGCTRCGRTWGREIVPDKEAKAALEGREA